MKIVWDEPKRLANIDKHGLDFARLDVAFFLDAIIRLAKLNRLLAVGQFADGTIAVVFALVGSEGISIISMRPANKLEKRLI